MSTSDRRPWICASDSGHESPSENRVRGVLRRGRGRQDHHRRGDGAARRRVRPHRGGVDDRPGQAAGAGVGNQATSATLRSACRSAPEVPGELYAMMLDMRRTFDEMVIQYSGPDRAQAILDNQFYQTVATSLAGTQEYMAMEKLGQLLAEDRWDLVVVDTPPSRNALDFLDAPKRLGSFMDSRLWRLLLGPGRGIGRAGHRRGRVGDEGDCRRSSARRCSPTRQLSCNRWTPPSAASGRRPIAPMRCSSAAVPSSWWCRPPSRTRCGRRRSSSTGFPRNACRWPG